MDDLKHSGFAIVDLLNINEVEYLNSLSAKYLKNNNQEFISTSHFLSIEDSKRINNELHKIIKPKTDILFPELNLLGGTLATKIKGKDVLKAHNDWSIVDETKFNSYNLWIPLVNTNKENGTLGLIPGSHLWYYKLRGFGIPGDFETYTNKFISLGFEPELKAGQAILYNHKLVHYSRPNKTEQPRNVAIVGMKEKNAELCVSFSLDNSLVETYTVSEEDFYGFDAKNIKKNNMLINTIPVYEGSENWKNMETNYTKYLPEEFHYLLSQRQSFISKLLSKLSF